MSSSPRTPRIIRAAEVPGDTFVLDERSRVELGASGPVAGANDILAAANVRAREIVALAEADAERILRAAHVTAADIVDQARSEAAAEGYRAGHEEAAAEASDLVDLIRRAAGEGRAIRDQVAADAAPVVARAVMFAVRRIVGEYYLEDPGRTTTSVEDALRAASGQQIISVRVHPELVDGIRVRLADVAGFIVPDPAVELGGCLVDLEGGTLDASLDARLRLMELALSRAAGEAQL